VRFARLRSGTTAAAAPGGDFVDLHRAITEYRAENPGVAARLAAVLPTPDAAWLDLIDAWDDVAAPLIAVIEWAYRGDYRVQLDGAPPLPSPAVAILAVGANFATHAARSQFAVDGGGANPSDRVAALLAARQAGAPPWGFSILPRTVVGDGSPLGRPAGITHLDYEGEVATVLRVVDGTPTVWGVTAFNDVSLRDRYFGSGPRIDEGPLGWVLQKNFRAGSVCGPWLVVGEGIDENDLGINTRVNGEVRQSGRTSEMVYSFADVIEHLDPFISLASGDLIVSGTPAGTAFEDGASGAYLQDGDVVVVEVEGVGRLCNPVGSSALHQPHREERA